MKESIKMMLKKAMESINGHQATSIRAIINKINAISMEKCIGLMEACIKENGMMEFSMDMAR